MDLFDPACLTEDVMCALELSGLLADATFKRIDDSNSAPADSMYHERRPADKAYKTWGLKALVDENPKKNRQGEVGAEVEADMAFAIYGLTAVSGSEKGKDYAPEEKDVIDYRGHTYEVLTVERVAPYGSSGQMGYLIDAKRFR